MMSSPWSSLVICLLYVVAVEWALPRFMHDRKPMEFRSVIVAYNFAMVILSGYIFVEVCNLHFSAVFVRSVIVTTIRILVRNDVMV